VADDGVADDGVAGGGDRLAPVSYLFGERSGRAAAGQPPPPPAARTPRLRADGTASRQAVTGEAGSKRAGSSRAGSREAVLYEATPHEAASRAGDPREATPHEAAPHELAPNQLAPNELAPNELAPNDPQWNDAWGEDLDDDATRPSDAEVEKLSMKALGRRSLSRRELERLLRSNEVDEQAIEHECDRLARVGLLDDLALGQTLVATLQERKGLGRSGIAAELARRMLAPAAIEYALELVDSSDELERANALAVKRASQLRGLDRDTAVRRLSGYLARRGYSGGTVRAAVDQALAGRSAREHTVRFR
jgi:regulatory protein